MPQDDVMADPLLRSLAALRPNPAAFDRDELLFRAGRASVPAPRSPSGWKWACRGLVAAQAATLTAWLAFPRESIVVVLKAEPSPPAVPAVEPGPGVPPPPSEPLPANSYAALIRSWADHGSLPDVLPPAVAPNQRSAPATVGGWRGVKVD